jgi:hypothetical protein
MLTSSANIAARPVYSQPLPWRDSASGGTVRDCATGTACRQRGAQLLPRREGRQMRLSRPGAHRAGVLLVPLAAFRPDPLS